MCTVTLFFPKANSFVLTSNRDEAVERKTLPPEFYTHDTVRMLYPKDTVAGGTWIGVSGRSSLVCLLNGGFVNHQREEPYRKSRGLVVRELLQHPNLREAAETYVYHRIEPFTCICIHWSSVLKVFELVWDGVKAHIRDLDTLDTYIWSSSTLYSEPMKQKRRKWFADFETKEALNSSSILEFHKTAGEGDLFSDLLIDRGELKTCSITQVQHLNSETIMRYENLRNSKVFTTTFEEITV